MVLNKAVFLDRDGVLNKVLIRDGRPYPPATLDDVALVDGVEPALDRLRKAGFLLIAVTNQPDVARGLAERRAVEEINRYLQELLRLDDVAVCYHDSTDRCSCRKPLPGMLRAAAVEHHVDLAQSFMVGDRWRDIDAGAAAGCRTVLIDYGYEEKLPIEPPTATVHSIEKAAEWILQQGSLPLLRSGANRTEIGPGRSSIGK